MCTCIMCDSTWGKFLKSEVVESKALYAIYRYSAFNFDRDCIHFHSHYQILCCPTLTRLHNQRFYLYQSDF